MEETSGCLTSLSLSDEPGKKAEGTERECGEGAPGELSAVLSGWPQSDGHVTSRIRVQVGSWG